MGFRVRKSKFLPRGLIRAEIESLDQEGRGVARIEGKPVFIHGALPGEQVDFVYADVRRDYAEGRVEAVLLASPDRVDPVCPHFGVCGGCSLQHMTATAQIHGKQNALVEQLKRIGRLPGIEMFPPLTGPVWGYRHKARLGVKHVAKKGRVLVGFRERSSPFIADLEVCPVLHPAVGERLRDLAAVIGGLSIRDRVPQIEVAVGDRGAALVFRVLADPDSSDLEQMRAFGERFDFDLYLQRHGPDSIAPLYPREPRRLSYALATQGIEFSFSPTEFTQVNAELNRKMVTQVLDTLAPQPGDRVLDLFCGIGNFTLALAKHSAEVVGVEGAAEAVARAIENAKANGLANVEFHVADLTQSLEGRAWAQRRYDKVLLDPSRAGAEQALAGIPQWGASRIVYVSCNPATLARDAGLLVHQHGYRLIRAGVMDMFPQTAHVESVALFEK